MNKKLKWGLMLLPFILVAIYAIFHQINENSALKDASVVKAKIIDITGGRNVSTLYLNYYFNGAFVKKELSVAVDTFKVGDTILLKVSNKYHNDYYELMKGLKSHTGR